MRNPLTQRLLAPSRGGRATGTTRRRSADTTQLRRAQQDAVLSWLADRPRIP